jgi:hypothetical protein
MTFAATGTVTDSQGDKAAVSVSIGKPVPQLSLNQARLNACSDFDNITDSANQTMAIPLQITVTLTSPIATDVIVSLDGTQAVAPGGSVNTTSWPTMWATYVGNSPCSVSDQDGMVEWTNLQSNQTATWTGWELDPRVITPNDPRGSAVDQVVFLGPVVNFGNGNADFTADAAHSQNLLNCAGVQGGQVIAVDPSVAKANGCTAYTGS